MDKNSERKNTVTLFGGPALGALVSTDMYLEHHSLKNPAHQQGLVKAGAGGVVTGLMVGLALILFRDSLASALDWKNFMPHKKSRPSL